MPACKLERILYTSLLMSLEDYCRNCTSDENEVTSDDLYIVVFTGLGLGLGKATQTA